MYMLKFDSRPEVYQTDLSPTWIRYCAKGCSTSIETQIREKKGNSR
jgi:hypothetical protein